MRGGYEGERKLPHVQGPACGLNPPGMIGGRRLIFGARELLAPLGAAGGDLCFADGVETSPFLSVCRWWPSCGAGGLLLNRAQSCYALEVRVPRVLMVASLVGIDRGRAPSLELRVYKRT